MKAMILAAGLATRLRPLTSTRPKALVPVANRAAIDRVIDYLVSQGVESIAVNAHHHHRELVSHFSGHRSFGPTVRVFAEPDLLGTGGGIRNTAGFWGNEPFVVINTDILTDIELEGAYQSHKAGGAPATLILHHRSPYNQVQLDRHGNVTRIAQKQAPDAVAFTGIHILEPELLDWIPEGEYSDIMDCYRRLIASGNPPKGYMVRPKHWRDIGTIREYVLAHQEALVRESPPWVLGSGCRVDPGARLREWAAIGPDCRIPADAEIRRSILWEGITVCPGVRVVDSIVTDSKTVRSDLKNEVL